MKDLDTVKNTGFIDFMGKVEKVGFLLLNNSDVIKDSRQCLSIPETFRRFMSSQDLI
jgi:hypothetical protein